MPVEADHEMLLSGHLPRQSYVAPLRSAEGAGSQRVGYFEFMIAGALATLYSCDIVRLLFDVNFGAIAHISRQISLIMYGVTVILLLRRLDAFMQAVWKAPELLLLTLLPAVSLFWSTSPSESFVRVIAFLGSSLFGYYLAISFSPRELLRLLCLVALFVALLCLVLIFAVPSVGLSPAPWLGSWRGAFMHKNSLGAGAAMNAALLTLSLMTTLDRRISHWIFLALALNFLLLAGSGSLSAQVSYVVAVLLIFATRSLTGSIRAIAFPLAISALPLLLALVFSVDGETVTDLIEGLGKDVTLSGRMPIWVSVWPYITERFWLGFGYEAFWVQGQVAVDVIESQLRYRPYYSHNGILELFLSLGFVGVVVFLSVFAVLLWRLGRVMIKAPHSILSSLAAVWVLVFLVRNFSEASILGRDSMQWCMFMALYLMLADTTAGARAPWRSR